jgi:hypothetical protein
MSRFIPLALVLALAVPVTAFGQDEEYKRGQLYQVSTWTVDPADAMAFEATVKQVAEAAGKSNVPYRWVFWQDASQYMFVYPVDDFAYFDDPMQFIRSFAGTAGEAQMQEAMGKFQNMHIETVAEEMVEVKADWSYEVESFDNSTMMYGHLDVMWLKPGANEKFEALNKDWSAFFKDLGYPYPYTGHQVHFGDSGRVVYVTFIDDIEAYYGKNNLEKMIEAKNMGERWQKLVGQMNEVVRRWEHSNTAFRSDLSYWPELAGATN